MAAPPHPDDPGEHPVACKCLQCVPVYYDPDALPKPGKP